MFFEGKIKEIDRIVVSEPGRTDGGRFELRGISGKDLVVSGILKDFTELADKSFLDEIDDDEEFDPEEMIEYMNEVCAVVEEMDEDEWQEVFGDMEDEECNAENHFGLVRGVKFIVGLMDPRVSVKLRFERDYDAAFDVLPCEYGEAPDEVVVYTVRSESGCLGLGADEKADGLCLVQVGGVGPGFFETLEEGDFGEVFVGVYGGKVRFVIIAGTVVDYDVYAQETVYRYLVDALKIDVSSKIVFDELALQMMKMGIQPEEMGFDEGQAEPAD